MQSEIPSDCIVFLQSSVCEKIMELLGQNKIDHHQRQVAILSQDSFYKVLTPEQKAKAVKGQFNFDHPGMSTGPELVCGRCVYYKSVISAACFFIASVRLFSVLELAHPVFGAWVPLLIILNPCPQRVFFSRTCSQTPWLNVTRVTRIVFLGCQTHTAGPHVSLQAHPANKTEFSTM